MSAGDANLGLAVKLARLAAGGRGQSAETSGSREFPYEQEEEVGFQTGFCFAHSYKVEWGTYIYTYKYDEKCLTAVFVKGPI